MTPLVDSNSDISPLLQPLTVGSLQLKNRFVLPSMQRHWCVDGAPDERLRNYYRRRVGFTHKSRFFPALKKGNSQ